jgi:hypothetical protein
MSKSKELLESIVDRKPSETAEIFAEALTEKIKEKITAYSDVVAENFFETDSDDEAVEDSEEESSDGQ